MNSPVNQQEVDEVNGSETAAPNASSCHNATDTQVLAEQVRQLYGRGKAGSVAVFIALIVLWLPFMPYAAPWTIVPPLIVQLCAQMSFNALRKRYVAASTKDTNPRIWGERYSAICLLSGFTWGLAALLWLGNAPFPEQAMFCLVVAALALNSILSRHVYPRALFAYTLTAIAPLVITLIFSGGMEATLVAGLGLIAWSVASSGLHSLYKSSEETIALRFQNMALIDRLAESTVIAEQKARDAERAMLVARKAASSRRDFLSMVAHEIRSPLANLSGLVDLLSATRLDETQKNYAAGVQESSHLLNRLVDDLADLTEMEALSINLRPVDMSPIDIAEAAIHLTKHEASARHLSLVIDALPETPSLIHNDPDRVKQTLVNLILRALRTTEKGGVIVRLSPVDIGGAERGVRFSVTDTGEGMPPEEAARLFSPDEYDEDRGRSRHQDVNLTICDRLVRLMDGRIGADSSVGNGFTAWFILACALPNQNKTVPPQISYASSGQIVDLDRIFEMEQELGSGRIADHLNDVIGEIADMQKLLAEACRAGDLGAVKEITDKLSIAADKIGLTGLAETSFSLLADVNTHPPQVELREKAAQLDAQFHSGARALARAYPALAR